MTDAPAQPEEEPALRCPAGGEMTETYRNSKSVYFNCTCGTGRHTRPIEGVEE